MYNQFFGFKERPFKLVPNPEYLYLSQVHEEVLAHLNYAAGYGEGFVEITGEVGTGKTTLCRMFLENLDENTAVAYIFNPKLDALQLLKTINDEFGIPSDTESIKTLIDSLNTFLLEKKAQDKRVILLVDEAQNLSADVLEQLRLLSNLETTTSKLIQIILVGQPELGELLETDALRQLNQRITLRCHLIPLNASETREYIRHRIHVASRRSGLDFTDWAYRLIFNYTGGIPRLINIACDRALLTAFTLGQQRITSRIVKRALRELDGKKGQSRPTLFKREKQMVGLLVVLVILVAGMLLGQTVLRQTDGKAVAPIIHHRIEKSVAASMPAVPTETTPLTLPMIDPPPELVEPATDPWPASLPAPVDPVPAPRAHDLGRMIDATDARNSRLGALTAVLTQWHAQRPLEATPVEGLDSDTFFRVFARYSNMEVVRVQGNLKLIRKLNLPAILEFPHPEGSGSRFMAVVGLTEDAIQLSDGEVSVSIAPAALAGLWNGVAYIPWKNFFNYTGVIPVTSPGDVILSLKVHLKTLGYAIQEMTPAYDTATRMAVEAIQARNGLDVDGRVGPLTKIALYNEDQTLKVPRLANNPRG